jgi:hypothetical protein
MKRLASLAVLATALFATGCTFKDQVANENFQGLKDMDGNAVSHYNYTKLGLNLLFTRPLVNDPSLEATIAEMAADAKANGNTKIRIVQSDSSLLWWCFPPISFIITPALAYGAADVTK